MRLSILFGIIFLSAGFAFAQQSAPPLPERFQSWNDIQLIVPVTRGKDANGKKIDKLTATFTGTIRVGRSSLSLLDNRAGATLDYRLSRHFSIFAASLYRRDEFFENIRRYETRLDLGATISATRRNFTFRDRNMFEHRFRNSRSDLNLYRNRIQINYPLKRGKKELFTPFVSEEAYYDLGSKTFIINEFFAGVSRKLSAQITIDIAYIRYDTRPTNVDGLSLSLKIKLR